MKPPSFESISSLLQMHLRPELLEPVDGVGRLASVSVVGEMGPRPGKAFPAAAKPAEEPEEKRLGLLALPVQDVFLCRLSRNLRSSLAASPALLVGVVSSTTVSASLSSSSGSDRPERVPFEDTLLSLMLRREFRNGCGLVGFLGSGMTKEVFLEGISMGSSSSEDASSSSDTFH